MKEMSAEFLQPNTLWETHMGLRDELEEAGRNRELLADTFGEKSEIAQAAVAIEVAIRALRDAMLAQFSEYVDSGAADAAIDAVESTEAQ
jgi:hypothetical protein